MDALGNLLISALSFVAVLSVVVFVHEFGHFQAARWLRVAIDTFSIGFGKTLAGWQDKQGVTWKIGALPLGGYVKFTGDADAVSSGPAEPIADEHAKAVARAKGLFHAQPIWIRAIVVAAGPFTNFLFSIVAYAALAMVIGIDDTDLSVVRPHIVSVAPDTAAAAAGLQPGETIEAVDGRPARGVDAFRELIASSPGREMSLTLVNANGETRVVAVAPRSDSTLGEPRGLLGVGLGVRADERVIIEHPDPIRAVSVGAAQTWNIISMTVDYLGQVLTGRASGRDIAGPVGIFMHSGTVTKSALEAADQTSPLDSVRTVGLSLLNWAALLSVAVGFVNLLPIPILDGGHLMFYAVEAVRGGRPLPAIAQEWAFRAGLVMMAGLFLFATWNDISRGLASASG